ncbi:MAG TPA: ADOP family duplicated permease [Vicinamibacterales bacterium]|nr:ADOP family duplicated permease [Vicinamibacterales bacterium]
MPDWQAVVRQRLRAEPDVVAELAQQLEQAYEAALADGLPDADARARAEAQVPDWPGLARAVADARAPLAAPVPLRARLALAAAGVSSDTRQAVRGLFRAGGFAAAAIATLGLGIGLCVAMFGLANVLVLRPLPFPEPQRVMALLETSRQFPQMGVSWPDFQDWATGTHSFEHLTATRGTVQVLARAGGETPAEMITGLRVTSGYFPLLGARPALGRTILPADDRPGAADVVVASWSFFQRRLGGDRSWLGRTLDMDGRPRTLVGVMPPGFPGLPSAGSEPEFWQPLGPFIARNPPFKQRSNHAGILVLGRLRPGVSQSHAEQDVDALMHSLAQAYPATNQGVLVAIQPFRDLLEGDFRQPLLMLLAASGLVLLIACLNVVNLVLARSLQREREQSIRAALGASWARLLRGQVVDAFVLSLGGAAVGLGLAAAALRMVTPLLPALGLPIARLGLSADVYGFSAVVVTACGLICGLAPAALGSMRGDPTLLHSRTAGAFGGGRAGRMLVAAEMLGSVVLLIGSGLVIHSLMRLQEVRYGFEPQGRFSFIIGLTANYPTGAMQRQFFREAERRLTDIPGVAAAGGAFPLPLAGYEIEQPYFVAGRPQPERGREPTADVVNLRGRYFAAMGMRLLAGRPFTEHDDEHAPDVAIVDDTLVRREFAHEPSLNAVLGKRIHLDRERTIVGVVNHVQDRGLAGREAAEIYIPQDQSSGMLAALSFVLQARDGDANQLRRPALAAINGMDPGLAATDVLSMAERVKADLAPRRAAAGLLGACAGLALLLACLGIYGVISFLVARRTHEIGIRMALGASRGRVMTAVLRQGLGWAAAGAVLGALIATRIGPALGTLLFGVTSLDPLTYVAAPTVLLLAAALACLLPARRATRVDPLEALRAE